MNYKIYTLAIIVLNVNDIFVTMWQLMKIIVLFNYPESVLKADQDTLYSAQQIAIALTSKKHEAILKGIAKKDIKDILKLKADIIFNLVEWSGKSYSLGLRVLKTLDKSGIPYTGSGQWGWKVASDKRKMKRELVKNGIATPKYIVVSRDTKIPVSRLTFPLVVKPVYEHCGIGITQKSVVENERQLEAAVRRILYVFKQPALVEEYIEGREIHVTVIEKHRRPWVLPPIEIKYKKSLPWSILSYNGKWGEDSKEFGLSSIVKAKLDRQLLKRVQKEVTRCYKLLDGKDYPRYDIRIRDGKPYIIDVNNNPGVGDDNLSGISVSTREVGLNFPALLEHIVKNALKRFRRA